MTAFNLYPTYMSLVKIKLFKFINCSKIHRISSLPYIMYSRYLLNEKFREYIYYLKKGHPKDVPLSIHYVYSA